MDVTICERCGTDRHPTDLHPETPENYYPAVSDLAETFPSLRGAPGVRPFDAFQLDRWRRGPAATSGSAAAAAFVLCVFNPEWERKTRFSVFDALASWDQAHHQAFLQWAFRPWWA